jgi:DNA modification methylase
MGWLACLFQGGTNIMDARLSTQAQAPGLSRGLSDMGVEQWPIERLRPHPRNYRRHPEHQLAVLQESLRVHGQQKPVVITPDGTILAGHGVVEAARAEGWSQVACHVYDGPYPEAFLAIDNRASDLAEDDEIALAQLLKDLDAEELLPAAGWDQDDLAELLARTELQPDGDIEDVEAPEPPEIAVSRTGDVWLLGGPEPKSQHRVMCADSTDLQAVAMLMDGERAGLLATDPPYGVAYDGNQHRRAVSPTQHGGGLIYAPIENDDLAGCELEEFLAKAFRAAGEHLASNAAWYVWHASSTRAHFLSALASAGVRVHQEIVWVKEGFQFGRSDYHWQHEPCLYGWREGHVFLGERNQSTVWQISRQTEHQHPTSKPVELWARPIQNHLRNGEVMLDVFLGSGTALIAAEQLGRRCCGMEIAPQYVDVSVLRWQRLTGKPAILAGDGRSFAEIAQERGVRLDERADE